MVGAELRGSASLQDGLRVLEMSGLAGVFFYLTFGIVRDRRYT